MSAGWVTNFRSLVAAVCLLCPAALSGQAALPGQIVQEWETAPGTIISGPIIIDQGTSSVIDGQFVQSESGDQDGEQVDEQEQVKPGTGVIGTGEINADDELNLATADAQDSIALTDLALFRVGSPQLMTSDEIKQYFTDKQPVVIFKDVEELPDLETFFAAGQVVAFYPLPKYIQMRAAQGAQAQVDALPKKFKAVITCYYSDETTKLQGLGEITAMKINGEQVDLGKLEATLDGNLLQFSRKHTKSEVHIYNLLPGEYEVEFEAEAAFNGKYYQSSIGKGKFEVKDGQTVGQVVFNDPLELQIK